MANGPLARELYEKMSYLPNKNLPDKYSSLGSVVTFKELSLYDGAVRVRVARVRHDDFDLENITSTEPLYYAQILAAPEVLNKINLKRKEKFNEEYKYFKDEFIDTYKVTDREISIYLQATGPKTENGWSTVLDQTGQSANPLFNGSTMETFNQGYDNELQRCIGGVCSKNTYFVKWSIPKKQMDFGVSLILPFGGSEGLQSSGGGAPPPVVRVNIINKQETLWGDIKDVLGSLFNTRISFP